MKFNAGLVNTVSVLTVDDKDEGFGARVVVAPEGADFVLASNILSPTNVRE